eukprot:354635-Chlamydomonas_euryale.AAC.8
MPGMHARDPAPRTCAQYGLPAFQPPSSRLPTAFQPPSNRLPPHALRCLRPVQVRDTVALTAEEQSLLGTLLDAARASGSGTVLRCAGGWVRDKLLGRESVDIDVALDNMMGRQFADVVNAHLKVRGAFCVLNCVSVDSRGSEGARCNRGVGDEGGEGG